MISATGKPTLACPPEGRMTFPGFQDTSEKAGTALRQTPGFLALQELSNAKPGQGGLFRGSLIVPGFRYPLPIVTPLQTIQVKSPVAPAATGSSTGLGGSSSGLGGSSSGAHLRGNVNNCTPPAGIAPASCIRMPGMNTRLLHISLTTLPFLLTAAVLPLKAARQEARDSAVSIAVVAGDPAELLA